MSQELRAVAKIVMVVDDEPSMVELERRILELSGYQVLQASSGPDALARLAEGIPLDLLIADVNMPGLDGMAMVRQVRATRPQVKVLFVTGHVDRLMETPRLWVGEAFLEKPFTAASLLEAVSLLLFGTVTKPPRANS
jgi:two-component system cell cycle sensor histidine kinase/response regulator CckA